MYYSYRRLLDYNYFKNCYKMTTIGLSKQQDLDADPKAIQQLNFSVSETEQDKLNVSYY